MVTGFVVFAFGVEPGIILAIVLSILDMVRRQYTPQRFVIGVAPDGDPTYISATPGRRILPGLVVFRYDAELFYANANRFVDDVSALMAAAPHRVSWLVLDCSGIPDVDYTAGNALKTLIAFVHKRGAILALAAVDPDLEHTLSQLGVLAEVRADHLFPSVAEAVAAFRQVPVEDAFAGAGARARRRPRGSDPPRSPSRARRSRARRPLRPRRGQAGMSAEHPRVAERVEIGVAARRRRRWPATRSGSRVRTGSIRCRS